MPDVPGSHPAASASSRAVSGQPTWQGFIRAMRARSVGLARSIHPDIGQVVIGSLFALLFGVALLLTPLAQVFGGLQLLAVTSGSMAPNMPVGGVVAILPVSAADLKVGDAITYVDSSNGDVLVTHRIVRLERGDGETLLTTQGDANAAADTLAVPASRIIGRVDFALPWLGYLMVWVGSPLTKIGIVGLAVLVLVLTSLARSSSPGGKH